MGLKLTSVKLEERLFDDFANQFEKSLVSELEYQLPKVVV